MPEPQRRLIVAPGTPSGRPARSAPCGDVAVVLAGLVGAAVEDVATAAQSTLAFRSISALIGIAPRSSARTDESAPP
jgi:hypothetical protein